MAQRHDLRAGGTAGLSWTSLPPGENGPIESVCLRVEQTFSAFQISTCISIEVLINSCQLEENYVNLLCIKYVLVSVSQSSNEFVVSNSLPSHLIYISLQ